MFRKWWYRWMSPRSRASRRACPTDGKRPRRCVLTLEALEARSLPSFAAPVAFDLPGTPTAVATGHFEGNSAPLDVVTANANGTVNVLLGKGDGTLQNPINLSVGGSLTAVAVGDVLHNGLQDIVAANANGTVDVLLSNGNGTFQAPRAIGIGATPKGVAVGDFNGDGRLDIVTANSNGTVTALLGNGDGTFQGPITSQVGGSLTSVAAGEFSGNGKTDLVVGATSSLSVLMSNGDGTFTVKTTVPFFFVYAGEQIPVGVRSVAVGDLRSDGKQDIVALLDNSAVGLPGNVNGPVSVLLGNGDGTFQAPVGLFVGPASAESLVVGDFTGDGKPDIVTSNFPPSSTSVPSLSVLAGNGDGTFQAARSENLGTVGALAAGDFRGNGKLDLALAFGDNHVAALLGNGDGTFATTPSVAVGIFLPSAVAAGDFTGDGKPDLVTTGIGGDAVVLLNNGDGTFRTGPTLPVSDSPDAVVVGDFNGDGRQDVAVGTEGGTINVFLGNGDGTFQAPLVADLGINNSIQALVAGDFNRDGHLDLAAASNLLSGQTQTALVTVLLGNGDGTFQQEAPLNVGVSPSGLAVADFNGDGRLDLVATTRFGTVTVLLNNGNGTFRSTTPIQVSDDITAVAVGDFFGDGKQDVAVTNLGHQGAVSSVSVLRGNGDGTFQAPITFSIGVALPQSLVAGDFFGDGKVSLAATNSRADLVSVFRGNGDGTFQAPVNFLLDSGPTGLVAGDFNGDGKLDLAAANVTTNDVSVLLNTSPPPSNAAPAATATSLAADTNPVVFGQSVTLTATVTSSAGTPTGTVTFRDGGTILGEVAVDPNGQASLALPLGVGSHSLTASFAGIVPFTASTSAALTETVGKAASTTALAVDQFGGQFPAPALVELTATVTAVAPGAGVPTGTVTFLDGSTVLGTGTLDNNGQAFLLLETGLAPGTHSLTASYGGDGNFQTSTSAPTVVTVNAPAATTTALSSSVSTAVVGQPVTLTATVTSSAGTPVGTVAFFENGILLGTAALNGAGQATLTVALGTGSYSLTASFLATSAFAGSSSPGVTVTVGRAASTTSLSASPSAAVTGQSVVFTATVAAAAPGAGLPTGTVTFMDGNVTLGTVAVSASGTATLTARFTTTGSHTITAVYNGDGNFTGSSQKITEQVSAPAALAPSTTALVASANPVTRGQVVTFTATVSAASGTGTPTGTITFMDGNTVLAVVVLDSNGQARLRTRFRTAGKHIIRAVYSGDSHFAASSQSLTEQVN
jgi:hypothetical protein